MSGIYPSSIVITTSRKPGQKTRRLAKVLARYFNWVYIQRGKTPILDFMDEEILVFLSEIKGNPSLIKVFNKGRKILSIRFNVGEIKKIKVGRDPVVFLGKSPFDPTLLNALPEKYFKSLDTPKKVFIKRRNGKYIFELKYYRETILKLICYYVGVQVFIRRH